MERSRLSVASPPAWEIAAVVALFALSTALAAYMQQITVIRYWDSDHYYWTTYHFATHQPLTAAAPYVYRIGLPWLVSFADPYRFDDTYRAVNVFASGLSTVLLVVWLRGYLRSPLTRLLLATLFVAAWHGPVRFVYYYPLYVDPPMFALLLAGLMANDWARRDDSTAAALTLVALAAAGTLVREVMIVVPLARLCVTDRDGRGWWRSPRSTTAAVRAVMPLAASIAAIVFTHLVTSPRAGSPTFTSVVIDMVRRKPLYTWALGWFFTFGPVLAILVYDWRRVVRFLEERRDLAVFVAFFAALSYVGGTDTERLLFWAMPVVYVLIGRTLEAEPAVFTSVPVIAVLAVAQAISARVFWPIPNPDTNVAAFGGGTLGSRIWPFIDRIVVIDDYHWNLWSTYGSRPAHALTLAWDVAFVALVAWWLTRRSRACAGIGTAISAVR